MNSHNIFNYKEIFSILMFILVMIMITEKLSPSYVVPISGHLQNNIKRNVDDNAFSNLSRNMTSTTNSIGPNLATGDRNSNSPDNMGLDGTSDNGISSSIFTQHGSSNSNPHYHSSKSSSGSIFTQHGYQLTVNVPPYPFGTSTTDISITTANGYTDQANVSSSDVIAWTFNIPQNQGNWVRVCINSENSSRENCNTYNTTGADMSVSPSPVLDNNNGKSMYRGNHGIGGFSGHHVDGNHGIGDPVDHLH
ncbi:MAG: hypothetical protein WAK17_12785 [Candidatus Nitrosopolaris sp.]|jgi:hypothetical protein